MTASVLPELVGQVVSGQLDGRAQSTAAAALAADPAALRAARALVRQADEIAQGGGEKKPPGRSLSEYVDEILAFAKRPRLSFGFPELDKVAPWPVQCIATVLGPAGHGKTSLALQLAQYHARERGPVLFLSRELAGVLAAARVVSQNDHAASWIEVLDGKVPKADLVRALVGVDVVIADEIGVGWVGWVKQWLAHWKKTRPKTTPLIVCDYLQIMPWDNARDDAERVKMTLEALSDQIVKPYECGAIAISKPSRANSRALRSGESFGADTAESGAETNAIEFYSTVQLAIGGKGEETAEGWTPIEISVGKARYRGGDHVVPFEFHGRSGVFREKGGARTTAEVKREREVQKEDGRAHQKRDSVLALLADGAIHSTRDIYDRVRGRRGDFLELLRGLVAERRIEEVGIGAGKAFRIVRAAQEFG